MTDQQTIVEHLIAAKEALEVLRLNPESGPEAREFALAITHTEDAIIRTNLGWARRRDVYSIADVQRTTEPAAVASA